MAETGTVIAKFTYTAAMLYRGYVALNRRKLVWLWMGLLLLTAVTFGLACVFSAFSSLFFGLAALCIILPAEVVLLMRLKYRAIVKEPAHSGETEVAVDPDCLRSKNANVESRFEWSMFTGCVERPDLFVLRVGKKLMLVIPKSGLADEDGITRFRDIVSSKISAGR